MDLETIKITIFLIFKAEQNSLNIVQVVQHKITLFYDYYSTYLTDIK